MSEFLNPAHSLEDIAHVFEQGAEIEGGITIDEDLCLYFVEGLRDAAQSVETLVAFVREQGLVQAVAVERDRTPVERQRLARLAMPLDAERRVLSFPQAPARFVTPQEGGTAA